MCARAGAVEAEGAAFRIRELPGVDRRAHQAPRRMRLRTQQVVPDLVRHGAPEHHPEPVLDGVRPFEHLEALRLFDDPAGAGDRRDGERHGPLAQNELAYGERRRAPRREALRAP